MTSDHAGLPALGMILAAAIAGDRRYRKRACAGDRGRQTRRPIAILVLSICAAAFALIAISHSEGITPINQVAYGWYVAGGMFLVIPPVVGFGRNAVFLAAAIAGLLLCVGLFFLPAGVEQATAIGLSAGMWPWIVVLGVVHMVIE